MLKVNLGQHHFYRRHEKTMSPSIHGGAAPTLALLNMKELEDRLPAAGFMLSQTFIVAIRKITSIEGNSITCSTQKKRL